MRPVIGITTHLSEDERTMSMGRTYSDVLIHLGAVPVMLPATTDAKAIAEYVNLADGVLLSGGCDVNPLLFGENTEWACGTVSVLRDAFEMELCKALLARGDKPILGICRGFQALNVALGGTLYQDLVEQKGLMHSDPELRHAVRVEEGSVLYRLFGTQFFVNSTHHQAVKDAAPGLRITARSDEGIVEAFEHESLPILATQFHPERLTGVLWDDRTPDFAPLFAHFAALCQ